MKLKSIRLSRPGVQAAPGRMVGTFDVSEGYAMTLISNLRSIKIENEQWDEPVYIPIEKLDCYSPLVEA